MKPTLNAAVELIDLHPPLTSIEKETVAALSSDPKWLPAKLFYDAIGSRLFEDITRLPEYYLTRTEIDILTEHADEIVGLLGENFVLVEFGSGNSTKVRILLDRVGTEGCYMPVDMSLEHLKSAAKRIAEDYPNIRVVAVCADYSRPFEIPDAARYRRRVLFFPGSTVGNFEPAAARRFFQQTAAAFRKGDLLIIGVDLKKDEALLDAAYNDQEGITARFNLNMLARLNRELGADFDLERFAHHAFYNREQGRIEMHLRSLGEQRVQLNGTVISFRAGETIHTENSYKYDVDEFHALLEGSGFEPRRVWLDRNHLFSVHCLEVGG